MDPKWRSQVQEKLLSLYLRLNGFFVTGFIITPPITGRNVTEIDVLAVRFPYNNEPERQVGADPLLETSDQLIDLVICEVKSKGKQLRFNHALVVSPDAIGRLLRWAGMFQEDEVAMLASKVQSALLPANLPRSVIPNVIGPRQTRIRGLLCSPERKERRKNQAWFLSGSDIFDYISRCLCPPMPRDTSATTYDYELWGTYEVIVSYFKEKGENESGDVQEVYGYLSSDNR